MQTIKLQRTPLGMKKNKPQHLRDLLEKYRSNSLSEKEYEIFLSLLGQEPVDELNQTLEAQAISDWQGSRPLLENLKALQDKRKNRIRWRSFLWKSAAAFILLFALWFFWPAGDAKDMNFQTSYGETRNIILPDGSQVLLNANSTLTWIGGWEDRDQRSVILTGEAFFEVENADNMPFEVRTPHMKVRVLGTEFNVKTRGEETQVFLHSGKVNLDLEENGEEAVEMVSGDFVRFNYLNHSLESVSHSRKEDKASWVEGMLEFQNVSVPDILEEFESLYGKKFVLGNPELQDKRLDLSLPYADWDLVRKALEIALDVEFTISGDSIIVRKQK